MLYGTRTVFCGEPLPTAAAAAAAPALSRFPVFDLISTFRAQSLRTRPSERKENRTARAVAISTELRPFGNLAVGRPCSHQSGTTCRYPLCRQSVCQTVSLSVCLSVGRSVEVSRQDMARQFSTAQRRLPFDSSRSVGRRPKVSNQPVSQSVSRVGWDGRTAASPIEPPREPSASGGNSFNCFVTYLCPLCDQAELACFLACLLAGSSAHSFTRWMPM